MTPSSPRAQPDCGEMTAEVRKAIFEILCMHLGSHELDKMIQALQSKGLLVDQVQVCCILLGDPRYAFVPADSNDEIEITLLVRQWPVSHEGTKLQNQDFA